MNENVKAYLFLFTASLLLLPPLISAQETSDSIFAVHVVQRGENLFRIALKYDRYAEEIAEANGITDSDSISVGQRLIIPLAAGASQSRIIHVVTEGETLANIAARYDKKIADLMALNNLSSADLIYVGQELTIVAGEATAAARPTTESQPGAPAVTDPAPTAVYAAGPSIRHSFSRYGDPGEIYIHTVKSGETLSAIGLSYNLSVDALARANNIADPGFLRVGQRLVVPGVRLPQLTHALPNAVMAFTIDPLVFQAGRSGRVELLTSEAASITGQFLGRELRVIQREGGKRHNILVGVPMFTEMSIYPLTLTLHGGLGDPQPVGATVQVIAGGYGRQTIKIADSELLAPAVEEDELAQIARVAEHFTTERSWTNSLSLPAAAPINAVFGTLRSYNGSAFDRYHGGVDFAGAPGTSVLAAAAGTVVMADRLNIRGNTTMIDHGWGLYTLYAHQDETLVQLGENVTSGQVIGTVGSTGRSTGPHLHWEVWLNGVNIDPMQWVQEAFP